MGMVPVLLQEPRAGKCQFPASSTDGETLRAFFLQPYQGAAALCSVLLERFAVMPGWDDPDAASTHVLVLPSIQLGQDPLQEHLCCLISAHRNPGSRSD